MKIILATLGLVGDVQPLIALAIELRRHAHQPIFAVPSELLPYPRQHDFETIQIGPDLREMNMQSLRQFSRGGTQFDVYREAWLNVAPQVIHEIKEICFGADLLICTNSMYLGMILHDLTDIPFVSILISFPYSLDRRSTNPNTQNTSEKERSDANLSKRLNALRVDSGLPPLDEKEKHNRSPQLALLAMSRAFFPSEHEWLKQYHVTGSFLIDEEDWQPDADLTTFIQAGPPPVIINLGSMVHDDPANLSQLLLNAVKASGYRAIIQSGWTGLANNTQLAANVYKAGFIPHVWLFSRAACVIHHGGVGTTVAALRAGVPTIVLPHAFDQFATAQRTLDLGCTGGVLPLRELNIDQLSATIIDTCRNPSYRAAAVKIGQQIEADQGVRTARVLIEQFVASTKYAQLH